MGNGHNQHLCIIEDAIEENEREPKRSHPSIFGAILRPALRVVRNLLNCDPNLVLKGLCQSLAVASIPLASSQVLFRGQAVKSDLYARQRTALFSIL